MSDSSSKGKKKAAFYQRMQQLRSAANSSAMNNASILVDASKYIEDLKERVAELNQDVETSANASIEEDNLPAVNVEGVDEGFQVNVYSEKKCPGLLVSILEAFEELGLEVLDARVSCSDNFHLQAVSQKGEVDGIDAKMVKKSVVQAIKNWSCSSD